MTAVEFFGWRGVLPVRVRAPATDKIFLSLEEELMGVKHGYKKAFGVANLMALSALATLTVAGISQTAQASNAASDNAGNLPYFPTNGPATPAGWASGQNGGTGFGAWSMSASTSGGYFVASRTFSNVTPFFDIYEQSTAPTASTTSVTRPFTGGALSVGQSVSFDFVLNMDATGGYVGFSLNDSKNNSLFQFEQAGNSPVNGYITDASGQTAGVGVPYNFQSLDTMSFTLTSPTTYNFDVNGALAYSGTISNTTGGIQSLEFFDNGGGPGSDVLFTNLAVSAVPAPSTLAILAGGLGLAAGAVRRRVGSRG